MKKHFVYRVYDPERRLLYVGVTDDVERRLGQHRREGAPWMPEFYALRMESFATRTEAEAAETESIAIERPLWNVSGSADPTARDMLKARRQARAAELQAVPQPAVPPVPASPADDLRTAITLLTTAVGLLADLAGRLEAGPGEAAQAGG